MLINCLKLLSSNSDIAKSIIDTTFYYDSATFNRYILIRYVLLPCVYDKLKLKKMPIFSVLRKITNDHAIFFQKTGDTERHTP